VELTNPSLGCPFFNQLSYRYLTSPDSDAVVELDLTDDLRGPGGSLHAGVIALLADVAGAMAVVSRTERITATSAVSVHNLATGRVGPIRASATMLRASKNSALADVRVTDAGADDRLIAAAHVTLAFLAGDRYEAK
jgi:uncharacterized protein (TIGR00369 family)